jgi:dethiobiotin synthetase
MAGCPRRGRPDTLRGLFVAGTDTGVGKTVLAASMVAALRSRGSRVVPLKPVITGLDEPADPDWPPDHELLALAGGCAPREVALVGYGPPVSPHLAAEMAAAPIDPTALCARIAAAARNSDVVIVEGVGGLLVPLAATYDVRRLAADLGLPLVIAARPGLGTINHTLLALEAARTAGLEIAAVVLTPWPTDPDHIESSNADTIARLGGVEVAHLPPVARGDVELLAAAARKLPLERWLAS